MGIINITPDSFSGDGELDLQSAVDQAKNFELLGADIIDVGGESTRPGSKIVNEENEWKRIKNVIINDHLAPCFSRKGPNFSPNL